MSARRSGLGRGLDALLGSDQPSLDTSGRIQEISIDRLEPNPMQPRGDFDETALTELADSIREQGVIQPIVVSTSRGDRFWIVAGERRWRAARRAGLDRVPVVVREVEGDQRLLELALVENLQRSDLNPIEEAEAYAALRERFGLSQKAIGERVGKSRTTVTNLLRLLRLPEEIRELVRSGQLTAGQARPMLSLANAKAQLALARRALAEGLSARQLEQLASAGDESETPKPRLRKKSPVDVHTRNAQEKLTRAVRSKVEIQRRGSGGEIRIHFHSEDELMRLYDLLLASSRKAR